MEKNDKYIVEAPKLKPGQVVSKGGIKESNGQFSSLFKNAVPYYEPPKASTQRIQIDNRSVRDAYKTRNNSMLLEGALYGARYIAELPAVKRRANDVAEIVSEGAEAGVGLFFDWLFGNNKKNNNWREVEQKEQKYQRVEQANQKENRQNISKEEIEELKKQGKIIDFPNKKVI